MNEKLKKLSKKVEGLISDGETPQLVYDKLTLIAKKQKEYFNHLGPDNLIKLVFYIYSIKKTNSFKLGDKMINNLSFIKLVQTEGNHTVNTCDECDGNGELDCELCDRGEIECDECDGNGEVSCPDCGGDGRQMGDGELEDCEECDGTGNISCPDCGGEGVGLCDSCSDGKNECSKCYGHGEIESETDYDFYVVSIVTWDRDIANVCELRENNEEPAMSEYDFDRLRDEYILLFSDENSKPLNIQENKLYCIQITTEPELKFINTMNIKMFDYRNEIDHLLA
jgi:hypothetical protein